MHVTRFFFLSFRFSVFFPVLVPALPPGGTLKCLFSVLQSLRPGFNYKVGKKGPVGHVHKRHRQLYYSPFLKMRQGSSTFPPPLTQLSHFPKDSHSHPHDQTYQLPIVQPVICFTILAQRKHTIYRNERPEKKSKKKST